MGGSRAVVAMLLALVACECGAGDPSAEVPDDAGRGTSDSPYAPRDASRWDPDAEPCARDIRAVAIDVPPFAGASSSPFHVSGDGDRVWASQTRTADDGRAFGRLTIADARTGEQLSFGEMELPPGTAGAPVAARTGDVPEVLFTHQSAGAFAAIARFDPDGPIAYAVPNPDGVFAYHVHAATALPDGFLLVMDSGAEDGWVLARIAGRGLTITSLGLEVDVPSTGLPCASVALSEVQPGPMVYGAVTIDAPEGRRSATEASRLPSSRTTAQSTRRVSPGTTHCRR